MAIEVTTRSRTVDVVVITVITNILLHSGAYLVSVCVNNSSHNFVHDTTQVQSDRSQEFEPKNLEYIQTEFADYMEDVIREHSVHPTNVGSDTLFEHNYEAGLGNSVKQSEGDTLRDEPMVAKQILSRLERLERKMARSMNSRRHYHVTTREEDVTMTQLERLPFGDPESRILEQEYDTALHGRTNDHIIENDESEIVRSSEKQVSKHLLGTRRMWLRTAHAHKYERDNRERAVMRSITGLAETEAGSTSGHFIEQRPVRKWHDNFIGKILDGTTGTAVTRDDNHHNNHSSQNIPESRRTRRSVQVRESVIHKSQLDTDADVVLVRQKRSRSKKRSPLSKNATQTEVINAINKISKQIKNTHNTAHFYAAVDEDLLMRAEPGNPRVVGKYDSDGAFVLKGRIFNMWVPSFIDERTFHLDETTGKVRIKKPGVYLIYAQVIFYDGAARKSAGIYNDDEEMPLMECLAFDLRDGARARRAPGNRRVRDAGHRSRRHVKVYHQCNMSGLVNAKKNQQVFIKTFERHRGFLNKKYLTYWGIVKVADYYKNVPKRQKPYYVAA